LRVPTFALSFLLLLFSSMSHAQYYDLKTLPKGSISLLTKEIHDSWLPWSSKNQVAFLSYGKETLNLYIVDISEVHFFYDRGILFVAKHLIKGYRKELGKQVTFFKAGEMDKPGFNLSGSKLAFRKYNCTYEFDINDTLPPCRAFHILQVNLNDGIIDTLLAAEVNCFDYLSDTEIIYQLASEPKIIYKKNLNTQEITPYITTEEALKGIHVKGDTVTTNSENSARIYTSAHQVPIEQIKLGNFKSMAKVSWAGNKKLLTTGRKRGKPYATLVKIKSGKTKRVSNYPGYQPTISPNGHYVLYISAYLGGAVLYRIDK